MPAVRELLEWALLGVLGTLAFLFVVNTPESTKQESGIAFGIVGGVLAAYVVYAMSRRLRNKWLRLRHATPGRRLASVMVCIPVAYWLTFLNLFGLLLSAELLLVLGAFVLVALIVDYVVWIPTIAVLWLAGHLQSVKMFGRWTCRLGWVMLVLPAHSLLQTVRATGNLISVLLTERGARIRAAAAGGLVGVYIGSLVLLILSELLLSPVLQPLLGHRQATGAGANESVARLIGYLLFVSLYLGCLRLFLPALDLILDVGNYHLASRKERATYHQRVASAVDRLCDSGCGEVHILAHSLGSVLVYDWLCSLSPKSNSVAVLHTAGSPLDLFWYVDHDRSTRSADRAGLAGHVSRAWLNYYAHSDPVCLGSTLRHYDSPQLRVENVRLRWLGPFVVSHTRYWRNRSMITRLQAEITRRDTTSSNASG